MAGAWVRQRAAWAAVAALVVASLTACSDGTATASRPAPTHVAPSAPPTPHPVSWTWSPRAPRSFVPQGLARVGDRLYVTGYRWTDTPGEQHCQVLVLRTTDGSRVSLTREIRDTEAPWPTSEGPVCHHGGGAAYTSEGLWIAGSGRLWLVDPDDPGHVRRSWAVDPDIRASTVAAFEGRLWVGKYNVHGRGRLADVALENLLAPGVTTLAGFAGPGIAQARVGPAPNFVQGIAIDGRGRRWLSRSSSRCGDLVRPHGGLRRLIPGAEGLILVGRSHAWVLSESGSHHYQSLGGRPDIATLSYVDLNELTEGRCFRA